MRALLTAVILLFILPLCMSATTPVAPSAPIGPVVKRLRTDDKIAIKPLDDPANPFKGQYQEWDKWIYAHALPEDPLLTEEDADHGQFMLDTYVTNDGWMVPLLAKQNAVWQWRRDWNKDVLRSMMGAPVVAKGEMDIAAATKCRAALMRAYAPFTPKVPQWLANDPYIWSLVLPDGRVITQGEPKSKMLAATGDAWTVPGLSTWVSLPDWDERPCWHLWSSDGKLLASTTPLSYWWELTIPDFRQRIRNFPTDYLYIHESHGYIMLYDGSAPGHLEYAQYNWDGTPLPANHKIDDRDANPWTGNCGYDLPIIYAAQNGK